MHSLLVGQALTSKHRVVDGDNLIASQHASLLGRTLADDVLHTQGVVTNHKLDTHTRERAAQVVIGGLHILRRDIGGMRVKLCQNLGHSLLHQVGHIDGIDILVINDIEQVVQFVAARIDDAQPVARKVMGIERADGDTNHHSQRQPQG